MQLPAEMVAAGAPAKGKFRGVITAATGGRLRIEIFSPLGPPVSIIAIQDGELTALSPFSGDYLRADINDPNFAGPLAALPLPLGKLSDFVRGVVPLAAGERSVGKTEGGLDALWIKRDGELVQEVGFDPEGGWPSTVRILGDPEFELTMGEYRSVDGVPIPTLLGIKQVGSQGTASIELSNLEVNPSLPDDLFVIVAPAGAKVRDSKDF